MRNYCGIRRKVTLLYGKSLVLARLSFFALLFIRSFRWVQVTDWCLCQELSLFFHMLCVGSLLLLESIVSPYSQLEENERLCPRCAWIPKTARTLLKACTSFFNVCYWKPPRRNCVKIGEVFGMQPESSCLLGHCYLFLHQVSLQHVQGLFRLLLRIVPATTWTIFVGVKRGVEKGTRRQLSAFILGRSKYCRVFSTISFTAKPILKLHCPLVPDFWSLYVHF